MSVVELGRLVVTVIDIVCVWRTPAACWVAVAKEATCHADAGLLQSVSVLVNR